MERKQRLLISPTPNEESGMYLYNLAHSLSKYFEIVNYGNKREPASKELFKYLFRADIFLLNWIENEPNKTKGTIRYLMVQLFLTFAGILRKKVIWTFHNLEPHNKKGSYQSKRLMSRLKKDADLIIHHTVESMDLTRENQSFYFFHPFVVHDLIRQLSEKHKYDILIWGAITPYKRVAEFLEYVKTDMFLKQLKIVIAGKAGDNAYKDKLEKSLSENVEFRNRYHSDDELAILHAQSRYVFFSHQGVSVLNSGQLVVSLGQGANIIGPNKGAFKELSAKELIFTYGSFDEVGGYIKSETVIDKNKQKRFINDHSWENFAFELNKEIGKL